MRGIGKAFFSAALIYGLIGMLLGLHMAMSHDHGQMPTHAHIMVIGWVSFAVFGLFYAAHGRRAPQLLSQLHFWLAQIAMVGLVAGLWLNYNGQSQFEPVAAISALAYAASFLLFAVIAFIAMRAPEA